MEALSPTMEEGRLVEWKKGEGEPVAVGDVLAEVETDKAVMELVARAGGTLLKQVVPAGTTVPVSQLVALIGEPGESVENGKPAVPEQPACRRPRASRRAAGRSASEAPAAARPVQATPAVPAAVMAPTGHRVKASPSRAEWRPNEESTSAPSRGPDQRAASSCATWEERGTRPRTRGRPDGAGARPAPHPPFLGWRRIHRRSAHAASQDDRQAARPVDRAHSDLLPHDRGGHGAGLGGT